MTLLIVRSSTCGLLAAFVLACGPILAQSAGTEQRLAPSVLEKAPTVPQMIVDPDGSLHFGPRTVPPPALESPEARQAYTRQ